MTANYLCVTAGKLNSKRTEYNNKIKEIKMIDYNATQILYLH